MELLQAPNTALFSTHNAEPPARAASQNVLVVAGHADDIEVMLGEAVRAELANGSRVRLAYATQSEESTLNARWWRPGFVHSGGRTREARRGAKRMGVDPNNIHQYDYGDGRVAERVGTFALDLAGIITSHDITKVITTGPTGYDEHPDHIATHEAAVIAVRALPSAHRERIALKYLDAKGQGPVTHHVDAKRKQWETIAHFSQFPGLGFRILGRIVLALPRKTRGYMAEYAPLFKTETYQLKTGNEIV